MKMIIEQYGRMLLDLLVFAGLMVLLFSQITDEQGNQGIFAIMGAQLPEARIQSFDNEFAVYQTECQKQAPTMNVSYEGVLSAGVYPLEALVSAVDYDGKELEIDLLEVEVVCDGCVYEASVADNGNLIFNMPGIYTLKVMATDERNRRTVSLLRIPVNP